jgi:hypothetical protein
MFLKHVFVMHFGTNLVPKCFKMESPHSPFFGHFGTLAPQWGLRGLLVPFWWPFGSQRLRLGAILVTFWPQRLLWGAILVTFLTLCDHLLILSVTFVNSFRNVQQKPYANRGGFQCRPILTRRVNPSLPGAGPGLTWPLLASPDQA